MKENNSLDSSEPLYHADRPENCRYCYFWKNKKTGCTLGENNCYYLARKPDLPKNKCTDCPYAVGRPCVTLSCYRDLVKLLEEKHE